MSSTEIAEVSLQEKVPKLTLRTGDDFSSSSDEDDNASQISKEIDDFDIDHGEEFESEGNSGWADAMAKILKTKIPEQKETVVLAKAKTISDVLNEIDVSNVDFEIDGEIKEEKPDIDSIKKENETNQKTNIKHRLDKKKEWKLKARVKPSILEKNRERTLAKIATKGVVQLFNTVRNHQTKIKKQLNEAGSERRREKVLQSIDKQAFLDMLMGSSRTKKQIDDSVKTELKEEDQSPWHVLRDDFMMGGTMKDWDKKIDSSSLTTEVKGMEKEDDIELNKDNGDASDVEEEDDDDEEEEEEEDNDGDDDEEEDNDGDNTMEASSDGSAD